MYVSVVSVICNGLYKYFIYTINTLCIFCCSISAAVMLLKFCCCVVRCVAAESTSV
jgi:hypothetical protein